MKHIIGGGGAIVEGRGFARGLVFGLNEIESDVQYRG